MSKKEHLELIKQGVLAWNQWRDRNSERPDLFNINLSMTDISEINLKDANLWEGNLKKARLCKADLRSADLCFADISGSDLSGADLSGANLTEADLSGANLSGANLRNANLWGTNFTSADLTRTDLSFSDISGANFYQADLTEAVLRGANLSETKFIKANLSETDFTESDLTGADFTNTIMKWSVLGAVDLSTVIGLETVQHIGPSSIGIDTIFRSRGNIPEKFLLGAGVPEGFIRNLEAMASQYISFQSYLISYSHKDEAFAKKLTEDLQQKGIRCWMMPGDMKTRDKIRQTIRSFDKLLIVLSENSISTDWIDKEVQIAFEEELKLKKTILFPIQLDASVSDTNRAWTAHIRTSRTIEDFSKWKDHAVYQTAFNRLLNELGHIFSNRSPEPSEIPVSPMTPSKDDEVKGRVEFPETIYKIIGENDCPLYKIGDTFKISGKDFILPSAEEKVACLILLEDIKYAIAKYESISADTGYKFSCSGCTGTIRLEYKSEKKEMSGDTIDYTVAIANLLKNFSMFKHLDEGSIRYLVTFLRMLKVNKGDVVIRKGEPGKNLFIIVSAKVQVVGEGGMLIATMGKGQVFGEMSILSGKPVGATIKVVEPGTILYISSKDFRKVLQKFPSLQMYFTNLMAERLMEINKERSKELLSGMTGKLSEMPPSELFQTFNINQKTGIITLNLSRGQADMAFREGNLIRAEYDQKEGIDAFFAVLKEREGRFKFTPGLSDADMALPELGDFMGMLMEGIRRIDEAV